jgi:hypothetical protein
MLLSQIASGLKKETTNSFNKAFFNGKTPDFELDILKDTLQELGINTPTTADTNTSGTSTAGIKPPSETSSKERPQSRKEKRERERLAKKIESMDAKHKQLAEEKDKETKARLEKIRREVAENSEDAARIKRVLGGLVI